MVVGGVVDGGDGGDAVGGGDMGAVVVACWCGFRWGDVAAERIRTRVSWESQAGQQAQVHDVTAVMSQGASSLGRGCSSGSDNDAEGCTSAPR